jgi:hypothetical protein
MVQLLDQQGRVLQEKSLLQGSTIVYFDIETLYQGLYFVRMEGATELKSVLIE